MNCSSDLTNLTDFLLFYSFKVPQISQIHTDFFFYLFTFKSHADCADDADFLPLKVPQISQIHTDFSFTFFTFKSHADCADDADFLPLKFPRRRSHPAKHGEGKKQAVPRRSHPAKYGEGFDAPPTLERSGSEHRRAVTSFPSEKGRLG